MDIIDSADVLRVIHSDPAYSLSYQSIKGGGDDRRRTILRLNT